MANRLLVRTITGDKVAASEAEVHEWLIQGLCGSGSFVYSEELKNWSTVSLLASVAPLYQDKPKEKQEKALISVYRATTAGAVQEGPYTLSRALDLIRLGKLCGSTWIFVEGDTEWRQVKSVKILGDVLPPLPTDTPSFEGVTANDSPVINVTAVPELPSLVGDAPEAATANAAPTVDLAPPAAAPEVTPPPSLVDDAPESADPAAPEPAPIPEPVAAPAVDLAPPPAVAAVVPAVDLAPPPAVPPTAEASSVTAPPVVAPPTDSPEVPLGAIGHNPISFDAIPDNVVEDATKQANNVQKETTMTFDPISGLGLVVTAEEMEVMKEQAGIEAPDEEGGTPAPDIAQAPPEAAPPIAEAPPAAPPSEAPTPVDLSLPEPEMESSVKLDLAAMGDGMVPIAPDAAPKAAPNAAPLPVAEPAAVATPATAPPAAAPEGEEKDEGFITVEISTAPIWSIKQNNSERVTGPYTFQQVIEMLKIGQVTPEDKITKKGTKRFDKISSQYEFNVKFNVETVVENGREVEKILIKRRHPRVLYMTEAQVTYKGTQTSAKCVNISGGGVLLEANGLDLGLGDKLELQLLPGLINRQILVTCLVIGRIPKKPPGFALKFLDLQIEDREAITHFIVEVLKRENDAIGM